MRELHVVALSEDGRHVVLATSQDATSGEFMVASDARLTAAVRGDLQQPGSAPRAPLTPRDIQSRLRSGESAEHIATSAGVPLSKIERFAGPVLSEMAKVLEAARATVVARARLGPSALPLGEGVDLAIGQTAGLRPDSVRWATYRDDEGRWVVQVEYAARNRTKRASWSYDPATRRVTPTDPFSAALAHVEVAEPVPPRRRSSERTRAVPEATDAEGREQARAGAGTPEPAAGLRVVPDQEQLPEPGPELDPDPVQSEPVQGELSVSAPAAERVARPDTSEPVPAQQTAERPARPDTSEPAVPPAAPDQPATAEQPVAEKPVAEKPAPEQPAPEQPSRAPRPARPGRPAARSRAAVPGWADVLLSTSRHGDEPDEH